MKTKLHELLTVHSASVPTLRTWSKYGDDWQLINIVWKQSLDVSANGCKTYRSVFSGGKKRGSSQRLAFASSGLLLAPLNRKEHQNTHSLGPPRRFLRLSGETLVAENPLGRSAGNFVPQVELRSSLSSLRGVRCSRQGKEYCAFSS